MFIKLADCVSYLFDLYSRRFFFMYACMQIISLGVFFSFSFFSFICLCFCLCCFCCVACLCSMLIWCEWESVRVCVCVHAHAKRVRPKHRRRQRTKLVLFGLWCFVCSSFCGYSFVCCLLILLPVVFTAPSSDFMLLRRSSHHSTATHILAKQENPHIVRSTYIVHARDAGVSNLFLLPPAPAVFSSRLVATTSSHGFAFLAGIA